MLRAVLIASALVAALPALAAPQTVSGQLASRAATAASAGKLTEALDLYESAVVADPRNASAYLAMGRVYEQLGLPGKALRYYRLALDINPADLNALEAQATGLAARGAPSKADATVDRIARLCPKGCPQLVRANAALSKARLAAAATPAPAKPEAK